MTHARHQLRDYVCNTLLNAVRQKTAELTIHQTRFYPQSSFPYVSVYAHSEQARDESNNRPNSEKRYMRQLNLIIEAGVKGEDAEDAIDDLCVDIESAMQADETLGDRVVFSDLNRTIIEPIRDGESPILVARLTYQIGFRTLAADPETFLK